MSNGNSQHLNKLKNIHQKRLEILEEQARTFGSLAPPHILLEIDKEKKEIAEIDAQLGGQGETPKTKDGQNEVVKILFLAANPSDTTRLRLGEESRSIDDALRKADFRAQFELIQHHAVRVADLTGLLLRYNPDIVHFSGHGSASAGVIPEYKSGRSQPVLSRDAKFSGGQGSASSSIILEDEAGNSYPVPPRALSQLFSVLKDNIRCVVLNACFSQPQAEAIAEHIDCVVGMSDAILDTAAIKFATAFYEGLGFGRSVRTAFDLGQIRIDLELKDFEESKKPQLIAKQGSNPEAVYLVTGS